MQDNEDNFEDFINFRTLTPEEILQSQNRQTVLTPQEKFARILKQYDKRARRLRKYHFVTIETTNLLYVFDGEGIEICQVENSISGARQAREICLNLFLTSDNQNGGYTFSGPNFENLTDEEIEQRIYATHNHLEYRKFSVDEILEYGEEKKNFCYDCETQFQDRVKLSQHLCTEQWLVREFFPIKQRQYFYKEI